MKTATFSKKLVRKKVLVPAIIGVGILLSAALHRNFTFREYMGAAGNNGESIRPQMHHIMALCPK